MLVIDLARLEYLDSSGLGMLIGCSGRMDQSGGRMRVAGAGGAVAQVFEIVHASRILQLDADLESACRQSVSGKRRWLSPALRRQFRERDRVANEGFDQWRQIPGQLRTGQSCGAVAGWLDTAVSRCREILP
jgi:hypothetical protein